jgi:hypothetical protein
LHCLALSLAAALAFLVAAPSFADDALTSDGIVQALTPKHKTRGIGDVSGTLAPQQQDFVKSLKSRTRRIAVEERTALTEVVKEADPERMLSSTHGYLGSLNRVCRP